MSLCMIDGLEVLILKGEPEEMGETHGQMLIDNVHLMIEQYLKRSETLFEVPTEYIFEASRICEKYIPERFIRELKSLAIAADVSYDDLLSLNCLVDADACYMQSLLHCCNFVLSSPATSSDFFFHARNLDFPHGNVLSKTAKAIIRIPSNNEYHATLSITWAGCIGTLTGINASRLSVGEVGVPDQGSKPHGMPIMLLLREALERADNNDIFYEILSTTSRTAGFNIALADGKNRNMTGIEFTHSLCEHRQPLDGVLIVDDVCLCKNTKQHRLGYPAGAFRYARVVQMIKENYGHIDADRVLEFMKDTYDMSTGKESGKSYNCICNAHTIQSVLFQPHEGLVHVSHGSVPAPLGRYALLNLDKLWTWND